MRVIVTGGAGFIGSAVAHADRGDPGPTRPNRHEVAASVNAGPRAKPKSSRPITATAVFQQTAYNLMLFSQRRQLHRLAAECIERAASGGVQERFDLLARHWKGAEDYPKAIACLEKAGEQARDKGLLTEAQALLQESLALEQAVFGGTAGGKLAPFR